MSLMFNKVPDSIQQLTKNAWNKTAELRKGAEDIANQMREAISDLSEEIGIVPKKGKRVENPNSLKDEAFQDAEKSVQHDDIQAVDKHTQIGQDKKPLTTKEKEISQETLSDQALSLLEEAKIKKEAQKAGLTREAKMAKIAALKKVLVDVEFDNPEHAELVALFFKYVDEMESKHNRNKELGRRLEELEERLERFSKKESSDHKDRHPGQDKKREDK